MSEPEVTYDMVTHVFMCDGHVEEAVFMEALWDQWDTDWCAALLPDRSPVHHTYARFVNGHPPYWKLIPRSTHGAKPVTIIDGAVINLGPIKCPDCGRLMMMRESTSGELEETEQWECANCRTKLEITRRR